MLNEVLTALSNIKANLDEIERVVVANARLLPVAPVEEVVVIEEAPAVTPEEVTVEEPVAPVEESPAPEAPVAPEPEVAVDEESAAPQE